MHTVFSDGDVWPTVRIDEAFRDGLDAIAITDHLELAPKKDFIPVDLNAAWKIGEEYAKQRNLILVHSAEITQKMPPGHFNALFITDASLITKDTVWDTFEAAIKQGAFLQWNHPGWKSQQPDGIPRMYDIHRRLIKKGWLHGIEFSNSGSHLSCSVSEFAMPQSSTPVTCYKIDNTFDLRAGQTMIMSTEYYR